MKPVIHQVKSFSIVGPYTLDVLFADGVRQTINFQPVLRGELFGPLLAIEMFNTVSIDPEIKTLVWPNGADFDPATLHDWPTLVPQLEAMALGWEKAEESGRA